MHRLQLQIQTYIIGLVSLWFLGRSAFADGFSFIAWLGKRNYFFNNKAPITFLRSSSGINYTKDRLAALDHCEHVE